MMKHFLARFSANIFVLTNLLLLVVVSLPEVIGFPGVVKQYLGVPVVVIQVLILLILLLTLAMRKATFLTKEVWMLFAFAMALVLSTLGLLILEAQNFPNFVYSQLHIHLVPLVQFVFFFLASVVAIMCQYPAVLKIVVPIIFWSVLLVLRFSNPGIFTTLGDEDGGIEYLTAFAFGTVAAYSITFSFWIRKTSRSASLVMIPIFLVAFFLFGEEISWGQRLFELESPQLFREHNVQGEITLHNLDSVKNLMFYAYILVGSVGSLGWLIKDKIVTPIKNLVPSKTIALYFVPIFIYGLVRLTIGPIQLKTWEESSELLLVIGIFLTLKFFTDTFSSSAKAKKS